VNICIGWI